MSYSMVHLKVAYELLARQKRSLLMEEFTGEKEYDVSGYQFCTKEIMGEFVKKCVEKNSHLLRNLM
ncbi:MAG: hypothetical protein HDR04_00225 [Lachnospiraceae bacterium]|nr:hypothetical protein [Lachnospiraceae bacterium]